MPEYRSTTNRYKQAAKQDIAQAGLELREQQMAQEARETEESLEIRRAQFRLDQAKTMWDREKYLTEARLKATALEQSVKFQRGLSEINEDDPDFEKHLAALTGHLPYAADDPSLKPFVEAKLAARKVASAAIQKFSEDGIDVMNPAYHKRDERGWFRGIDWQKAGNDLDARRVERAKTAVTAMGGEGRVTLPMTGDVTVAATVSDWSTRGLEGVSKGLITPKEYKLLSIDPSKAGAKVDAMLAERTGQRTMEDRAKREQVTTVKGVEARAKILAAVARLKASGASDADLAELTATADSLSLPEAAPETAAPITQGDSTNDAVFNQK